jgi:hypothetical protein
MRRKHLHLIEKDFPPIYKEMSKLADSRMVINDKAERKIKRIIGPNEGKETASEKPSTAMTLFAEKLIK